MLYTYVCRNGNWFYSTFCFYSVLNLSDVMQRNAKCHPASYCEPALDPDSQSVNRATLVDFKPCGIVCGFNLTVDLELHQRHLRACTFIYVK